MWWLAIQRSQEIFKTTLPHGNQASCITGQAFAFLERKKKIWAQRTEAIIQGHHFIKCVSTESIILVANHIAKAKKPFTVGAGLILPVAQDTCEISG